VPSGVAWTAGSGEWKWLHGRAQAAQVKNKGLTSGVLLTVREEREDDHLEGVNQKGKHIFTEAPSAHGPDGSVREVATYEEGWADAGRAGLVGPDPGENSNGNFISNFK
jgi:hypothetical protein